MFQGFARVTIVYTVTQELISDWIRAMSSQNLQEELLEGEVLIYVRKGSSKGIWQARFTNPLSSSPRYIRESLKTASKGLATERAIKSYREYQSRAFLGLKAGESTILSLIEQFKNEFKDTCQEVIETCHKLYWSKYMGAQDLSRWTTEDVNNYFRWRIKEQLNRPAGRYHKASKDSISTGTLMLERSYLKALFNHAYKNQIIGRMPAFPRTFEKFANVHTLESNQRRGRFDPKTEYQGILMPEFKRIANGLKKKEWRPRLQDPNLPFNENSNHWVSATVFDHSLGRGEKSRDFTRKTSRNSLSMFRFAALLISATGVRPAEMVQLKHSDIRLVRDDEDGKFYTVVTISKAVSKINIPRHAISHDFEATYERYLQYRQELEHYFNREIKDSDWLFPKYGLNTPERYDMRNTKLHNLFRPHLQRLGLQLKESSIKGVNIFYSAYSFRSYYITSRLSAKMSIYILSKNVGASIETIVRNYAVNETWEFRNEMTQHLKKWSKSEPSKEKISELEKYAVSW